MTKSGREATSSPVIKRSVSDSLQYSQDQDHDQAGDDDRQRAGKRQHLHRSSRGQSATHYSTVKTKIMTRQEMMIDRERPREATSSPVIKRSVSNSLQYSQDQDQDLAGDDERQRAGERQHLHRLSRGQSATHYSTVKTRIRTWQEMMIDRERARGNIFTGYQEFSQQVVTVQSRSRSGPGRR